MKGKAPGTSKGLKKQTQPLTISSSTKPVIHQADAGINTMSSSESFVSMDEPPKDYELMLQKYEAEVRNHIKIEQQLKLHIECLQDKLEDADKVTK